MPDPTTDFIETVRLMRATQKEYFRNHTPDALRRAKALERQVDDFLKKSEQPEPEPTDQQLALFQEADHAARDEP